MRFECSAIFSQREHLFPFYFTFHRTVILEAAIVHAVKRVDMYRVLTLTTNQRPLKIEISSLFV